MQPEEKRTTRRYAGISRARLLLKKHIGWLPGFPIEMDGDRLGWQSVRWDGIGSDQRWMLTGQELRRAQMTITKLRHHFPQALPRIVDDVGDWLARMDFILGNLKSAIHGRRMLDIDRVRSLCKLPLRWSERHDHACQRYPRLRPLMNAIYYLELSKRGNADIELIEWIDQHADTLFNLGEDSPGPEVLCLQLQFCGLRLTCPDRLVANLARAYADPLIRDCQSKHARAQVQWLQHAIAKRISGSRCKSAPQQESPRFIQQIDHSLANIRKAKPKYQKASLGLLDLLIGEEMLDDIHNRQARIDSNERRLTRFYRQLEFGSRKIPANRHARKDLFKELADEQMIDGAREAVVSHLADCIQLLSTLDLAETESWTRFLRLIPEEHQSLRSGLLSHWSRALRRDQVKQNSAFDRVLSFLESLLHRRGAASAVLDSWYEAVSSSHSSNRDWIVSLCLCHANDHQLIDQTLRLYESVVYDHDAQPDHCLRSTLHAFAAATNDTDQAASVVARLADQQDPCYVLSELRPAFALGRSAEEIVAILTAFDNVDDDTMESAAGQLISLAGDSCLNRAILGRILAHDKQALRRMASIHQLLIALGGESPQFTRPAASSNHWMSGYPPAVQTELCRLAELTPRAAAIAAELLGKDFPDPGKLQDEIQALSAKLDAPADETNSAQRSHLQTRLANLQRRLEEPARISPARLNTLVKKLRVRIDRESIERFVESCRNQVALLICDRYRLNRVPDELLRPPFDAVLANVLQLSQPMKDLGLRLVFETMNRSTRRFDSEPANDRFRKQLAAKNIDMDVWAGDCFETHATTATGVTYRLSFTRDVMDFLLMGFHFDTCLSPGGCNFFATVANAVDINKRVVYGKTDSGRIIGRCLFALNDDGHLLIFHRYAHDPNDRFPAAVDEFAAKLATAMNSRLATRGTVQNLVAQEWYDDGAINLSDSETIDAQVRSLLAGAAPEALLAELEKRLSYDEICSRLDEFVAGQELAKRPAALRAIVVGLAEAQALTQIQRLIVARVAYRCKAVDLSMSLLAQISTKQLKRIVKRTRCDYCNVFHGVGSYSDVFDMLIEFSPSIAIRIMRASRDRRTRDDLQDGNPLRRTALAKAHKKLGRTRIAKRLMER